MSGEIQVAQTFEQKMKARIRDSIGDLITDEELSRMINKNMEEIFFAKRPNPKYSSYGSSNEPAQLPSLLHEIVKSCLQDAVTEVIKDYIEKHPDEVMAAIKQVISEGAGGAIIAAVTGMFSGQLNIFQNNIFSQLSSHR